jgi:hypothetical protein
MIEVIGPLEEVAQGLVRLATSVGLGDTTIAREEVGLVMVEVDLHVPRGQGVNIAGTGPISEVHERSVVKLDG